MKRNMISVIVIACLVVVAIVLVSNCSRDRADARDSEPLRIAFLPILDALPFHVAESEGYFEDSGVVVKGIAVASPVERDQLFQAGEIDGMLNELSTTAIFNAAEKPLVTVLTVRKPVPGSPVFRILAAPGAGIESVADLSGVPIGVSMNTIIEYLTFRLLSAGGLSPDEISMISVPVIPERFQLLMKGDVKAATLPDPLAQVAIGGGAVLVVDDSAYPEYSVSVLSFSSELLEENPDRVRRFIAAWNRAVGEVNRDPEAYRALFLEKVPVPEAVAESYTIPEFPTLEVPGKEQWDDVLDWLIDKGLIDSRPAYEDSVISDYF